MNTIRHVIRPVLAGLVITAAMTLGVDAASAASLDRVTCIYLEP